MSESVKLKIIQYSPTLMVIEIPEGFDRGNYSIPPGNYWLRHRTDIYASHNMIGWGGTSIPEEITALQISARNSCNQYVDDYQIQVFSTLWSDGEQTSNNCQIVPIVPVGGHPRQEFENEKFDIYATLAERKRTAFIKQCKNLVKGLYCSGYYYNSTPLLDYSGDCPRYPNKEEITRDFMKFEHPIFDVGYLWFQGDKHYLYGSQAMIEACYQAYREFSYWVKGWYNDDKNKPTGVTPEQSIDWLREYGPYNWLTKKPAPNSIEARGCAGHEFHEWNCQNISGIPFNWDELLTN